MLKTTSQVLALQMLLSTVWRFQALILLVLIPVSWAHSVFWQWLVWWPAAAGGEMLSLTLTAGCFCFSSCLAASGSRGMKLSQPWKSDPLVLCFGLFSPLVVSWASFWEVSRAPWRVARRWLKLWGAARHYRSSAGSKDLSCASQWSKPGLRRSVYYQEGVQSTMPKRSSWIYF